MRTPAFTQDEIVANCVRLTRNGIYPSYNNASKSGLRCDEGRFNKIRDGAIRDGVLICPKSTKGRKPISSNLGLICGPRSVEKEPPTRFEDLPSRRQRQIIVARERALFAWARDYKVRLDAALAVVDESELKEMLCVA